MKYYCDLHIHSALSPCGDADMTPNNIVNMACLSGLDIIAVADHNTIGNVEACMKVAESLPITVVPAMELETSEDVHFLCLFENIDIAREFDEWLAPYKATHKNRPEIFGEQQYMDENDEVIGTEENLLVTATQVSIYEAKKKIDTLPAVIIPAHVDRSSYSIISNLGFVPDDLGFSTVEISKNISKEDCLKLYPYLEKYNIITDSDSHYLDTFYEKENPIDLPEPTAKALINALKYSYK